MTPVTDPNLISQLEGSSGQPQGTPVTDPNTIAQLEGQSQPQPMSWQGLGQNALTDIGNQVKGAGQMVGSAGKTLYDLATGPSPITSPQEFAKNAAQTPVGQAIQQMPSAVATGVKNFANDPIGSMYRNPVTTALTAGTLAQGAVSPAEGAVAKGMSATLGPSEEAINARLADPSGIADASSYADLAHKLPSTLNTLKDQISQASENAGGTLRDSFDPKQGALPKEDLIDMLGELQKKLGTDDTIIGPAKKAAFDKLSSIVSDAMDVNGSQPNLSEKNLKGLIQSIDPLIDWTDKGSTASNSILTDLRGQLDQTLKSGNQDYANAMQPVSQKIGLLDSLKKAFSITNQTGEGLQPTDTTISKIQSLPSERKSITQDLSNQLKSATGQDYVQQSKNAGFSKQFQGGATQGSRRVNMGAIAGGGVGAGIGGIFGHPEVGATVGSGIGGAVGGLADKYGGPMAAGMIDRYAPIHQALQNAIASTPAQASRQATLAALLNKIYANQGSGPSR